MVVRLKDISTDDKKKILSDADQRNVAVKQWENFRLLMLLQATALVMVKPINQPPAVQNILSQNTKNARLS